MNNLAIIKPAEHSTLANLERARQALAEARTLREVKQIRDVAEAARTYAKAAHLSRDAQQYAAEIALLASWKAGEILKQLGRGDEGRPKKGASVAPISEYQKTLEDTSTAARTAQYWQKLAEVPEEQVQQYIQDVRKADKDITASGLLREHANESTKPKKELDAAGRYRKISSLVWSLCGSLQNEEREMEIRKHAEQLIREYCLDKERPERAPDDETATEVNVPWLERTTEKQLLKVGDFFVGELRQSSNCDWKGQYLQQVVRINKKGNLKTQVWSGIWYATEREPLVTSAVVLTAEEVKRYYPHKAFENAPAGDDPTGVRLYSLSHQRHE